MQYIKQPNQIFLDSLDVNKVAHTSAATKCFDSIAYEGGKVDEKSGF